MRRASILWFRQLRGDPQSSKSASRGITIAATAATLWLSCPAGAFQCVGDRRVAPLFGKPRMVLRFDLILDIGLSDLVPHRIEVGRTPDLEHLCDVPPEERADRRGNLALFQTKDHIFVLCGCLAAARPTQIAGI